MARQSHSHSLQSCYSRLKVPLCTILAFAGVQIDQTNIINMCQCESSFTLQPQYPHSKSHLYTVGGPQRRVEFSKEGKNISVCYGSKSVRPACWLVTALTELPWLSDYQCDQTAGLSLHSLSYPGSDDSVLCSAASLSLVFVKIISA